MSELARRKGLGGQSLYKALSPDGGLNLKLLKVARALGLRLINRDCSVTLHGLNFCEGTIPEMLDDPAREIFEVIRWFGERGKIFNVHFRNIKGRKLDFMEAFPDEGDMDMARSLAAYRDVGYPYMLMPDHVPQIDGRDPSGVAFAYCYGYIQALIDALAPRP